MSEDLRIAVLLSLQRALWQQVTPDLRGVAVTWTGELDAGADVRVRFLYEGAVADLQKECVSEAETYFAADFGEDLSTVFTAVPDAGLELEQDEEWVFLRWEPTPEMPDRPVTPL
ncbi:MULTISPECIES: hypothetical protein [unclassified Kribbella]|uniref:hypothetical protein n=1 Tax=unclassified Kribbella TaxID=2644121 RepID=UPI0030174A6D